VGVNPVGLPPEQPRQLSGVRREHGAGLPGAGLEREERVGIHDDAGLQIRPLAAVGCRDVEVLAGDDLHGRAFAIFWPPRGVTKVEGGRVGVLR